MQDLHNLDPKASERKDDHISLAFKASLDKIHQDTRFYYEPMLAGHPSDTETMSIEICGLKMNYPIWVSSMTGGTEKAKHINQQLAKACGEFGLGMGLGSCRQLLYNDERLIDFDVKKYMPNQPLLLNLGIAQIQAMIKDNELSKINELKDKLQADGLIIHVNPLQEWLQPEGDHISDPPILAVKRVLQELNMPIVVKEVGQGMGPKSLSALLKLPLEAIEFGAYGGTNFAKLELFRSDSFEMESYDNLSKIGHSAIEMLSFCNEIISSNSEDIRCKNLIISGGVKDFLDGYHLISNAKLPAIYAQASIMLKHAVNDYSGLQKFIIGQIEGLKLANKLFVAKPLNAANGS